MCLLTQETSDAACTDAGFRFVEVVWSGRPAGATFRLEGMHVHSRVEQIGHVHFESEVLNKIQGAILRTQLNNLHSLPSDCPTREKRGWMVSGATGTG